MMSYEREDLSPEEIDRLKLMKNRQKWLYKMPIKDTYSIISQAIIKDHETIKEGGAGIVRYQRLVPSEERDINVTLNSSINESGELFGHIILHDYQKLGGTSENPTFSDTTVAFNRYGDMIMKEIVSDENGIEHVSTFDSRELSVINEQSITQEKAAQYLTHVSLLYMLAVPKGATV